LKSSLGDGAAVTSGKEDRGEQEGVEGSISQERGAGRCCGIHQPGEGSREVLWDPSARSSQVPKYTSPGESLPAKASVMSVLEKAAQATCTLAWLYRQKKTTFTYVTTVFVPHKTNILTELPKVIHLILFSF